MSDTKKHGYPTLKTTEYRNGDPIRHAQSVEEWIDADQKGEGAYCLTATGAHLYNWHAVIDERQLAPVGKRIFADYEWDDVGHPITAKDGYRTQHGLFNGEGYYSCVWTTSESNRLKAQSRGWYYDHTGGYREYGSLPKGYGMSVVCMQDVEYGRATLYYQYNNVWRQKNGK